MISCAITPESKRALRRAIANRVFERMGQEPFTLKTMMKEIYELIQGHTGEHAQGVNYARLVPELLLQLSSHDVSINEYIMDDLLSVNTMRIVASKEEGLNAIEEYLDITN